MSAMIKEFKKRDIEGDLRGKMINEIGSYNKCIIPICLWDRNIGKKGKNNFNNVTMFKFIIAILFISMKTSYAMSNTMS